MLDQILDILNQQEELLITISIISVAVFVLTLLLTPYLLSLIPTDYFSPEHVHQVKTRTLFSLFKTIVKSVLGLFLILAGIIMLVTPGQGIISILLGLFLMEFPGKRKLEFKLINHNPTYKALNWLRSKAGKPPLIR